MELVEEQGRPDLTNEGVKIDGSILSEERLRQLGRNFADIIPRDGADNEEPSAKVQQLRLDLLHTAQSSNLSPSHGAAALNALGGFLEICSKYRNHQWASLCFCPATCKQLFHIYLVRSEGFKPKPAKQLLITLTNVLSRYPDDVGRVTLIDTLVAYCIGSISKQKNSQSIKPSLQALEHLLNKQIITAQGIIEASREKSTVYEENVETRYDYTSTSFRAAVEDFTTHVLYWVRYPDCASIMSRFLPMFFASLNTCREKKVAGSLGRSASPFSEPPLWIRPVKQSLERNMSLLDSYENHVLPGLLRASPGDAEAFLENLPLNELKQGNVGSQTDSNIQLCLLAVKMLNSGLKLSGEAHSWPLVDKAHIPLDTEGSLAQHMKDFDPTNLCINLIEHASADVRLAAFSLTISSSPPSTPLHDSILGCLRECIAHFHQEANPRTRNEFLALMKPLCLRLGNAAKTFSRLSAAAGPRYRDFPGVGENLMRHVRLVRWYHQYLLHQLRPTASYQSHITALKVLFIIFSNSNLTDLISSDHQHYRDVGQRQNKRGIGIILDHVRPLLDLFIDPFDDVRQSASSVFCRVLPYTSLNDPISRKDQGTHSHHSRKSSTRDALDASVDIALVRADEHVRRSGRADHADGVGRLYDLQYHMSKSSFCLGTVRGRDIFNDLLLAVEQMIGPVGHDQLHALTPTSLHGHVIALRYIVSRSEFVKLLPADTRPFDIQRLYSRLLACCSKIWAAVRSILCFDAPEGRDLHDDDDDDHETDSGSKDMLSFCWRALKESSLLMHAVVNQVWSKGRESFSDLDDVDYSVYGRLLFTQLAELRHRGAFSTVAQTFAAWCVMCSQSNKAGVSDLPKEWYEETIACIQQQASALTRRSAGLPAIITGILSAYPSGSFFDDVVLDLQAIADAPTEGSQDRLRLRLPQVHAMNCLKDIFTDSRFGQSTEAHVEISLGIAISSLESDIWAIRNCGLMLLKALLKRLNGGADTGSTRVASSHRQLSTLTYEKFPILPGLLLRLLHHREDVGAVASHAQRVFPALEIVERFGVPKIHQKEILECLEYHRASPVWSIREKAAKAFGTMSPADDLMTLIRHIDGIHEYRLQNELHGQLFSLRVIIVRSLPACLKASTAIHQRELFTLLKRILEQYVTRNVCPITVAAALNILADVAESLSPFRDDADIRHFFKQLKQLLLQKHKIREIYSSPPSLDHGLEYNAALRCLTILDDVIDSVDERGTRTINKTTRKVSDLPQNPLLEITTAAQCKMAGPDKYNQYLRFCGEHQAEELVRTRKPGSHIRAWVKILLLAGNAHSEFATRLAAVASINSFFSVLQEYVSDAADLAIPVEILTILYDTLVDDDEDVRNHGAKTVSSMLSVHLSKRTDSTANLSLSPPSARSRLLRHLPSIYSRSTSLLLEAIWRLTGVAASLDVVSRTETTRRVENGLLKEVNARTLGLTAVTMLLERATQQQNVVFEEEKQNLYLDPTMEAEGWSQVVMDMDPGAWPPGLAETVKDWVEQGQPCLLHALNKSEDGPLGLTSKADVFALFMQVMFMARALLFVSIKRKSALDTSRIMMHLTSLYEWGQERDLHPLIADRASGVLNEVSDLAL